MGKKQANAWGLYDMLGNVWEWTGDWYGDFAGAATDPTGAVSGSFRVFRGGSWFSGARGVRASYRRNDTPGYRYDNLGVRPSRTAP